MLTVSKCVLIAAILTIAMADTTLGQLQDSDDVPDQEETTISLDHLGLSSIHSALWIEARSSVVLVDAVGDRVWEVELRETGAVLRNVPPGLHPSFIGKSGIRFFQLFGDTAGSLQEIHWFDRALAPTGVTIFPARSEDGIPRATMEEAVKLLSWISAGRGDRIFAYGVLDGGAGMGSQNPHKSCFFTYKLKSPESEEGIPKADCVERFEESDYYKLGFPYFAAIGYDVYYLEMGAHPALKYYDIEQGGRPVYLAGLPGGNVPLPRIDAEPGDISTLFGRLETLEMPVGLYDDGGQLYILRRRPKSGGTEWTLTKLQPEPENEKVQDLRTVQLRTQAPHLSVLFTPRCVLVFEKSSVAAGSEEQLVTAVRLVPKHWVTDPGKSPLREE